MFKPKVLLSIAIIVFLLAAHSLTSACGGFFCSNVPIDQSAERIIFTVNGDHTITAIVGINYAGSAEDFSWVVPVPSPPTIDVAETVSLDILQSNTNHNFIPPRNYCSGVLQFEGGFGGGGDEYLEEGTAGPYDYVIIRNENADEMVQWLRDNGYRVTDDMVPIIGRYVHEGMYFLAMRLQQDAEVGDIQPVVMTYESDHPMIPIRLTAVAAVTNMPILTWVFADTQYVPENYAHPTPDYTGFRTTSQLSTSFSFTSPISMYASELGRIQQAYNGLAFVTEYAEPTSDLGDNIQADPLIRELIERFPYVTRLRAQMSPEQMTLDPTFIPDPNAPDVPRDVNLIDHVDPLAYWGCSTRYTRSESAEAMLPDYTYIEDLNIHIGHPDGWVLSQFTMREDGSTIWALAPEPVDASTIRAFFAGESTMPIFIAASGGAVDYLECNSCYNTENILNYLLQAPQDQALPSTVRYMSDVRYTLPGQWGTDTLYGVVYALLTSAADWDQNTDLYSAMLRYAHSYQYYASPDLRNTLFFGDFQSYINDNYIPGIVLGFPDGWTEQLVNGAPVIMTERSGSDAPSIRLIPIVYFDDLTRQFASAIDDSEIEGVAEAYGLNAAPLLEEYGVQAERRCTADLTLVPFSHDGRRGYIKIYSAFVLEVSASEAEFDTLDDTFLAVIESMKAPLEGCG